MTTQFQGIAPYRLGRRMLALVAAGSLIAACGSDGTSSTDAGEEPSSDALAVELTADERRSLLNEYKDWAEGAGEEWEALLQAGQEEGTVTIASLPNPDIRELITSEFERDTGIRVEYVPAAVPAELLGRLGQESAAGQVSIDIMLQGWSGVLPDWKRFARPVEPELVLPSVTTESNWNGGELPWQDNGDELFLRLLTYVTGYPVVNTDFVDPSEITSWDDLLDPAYRGQIAQFDPRRPGPGSPLVFWPIDKGRDFTEAMYEQQDITLTTDQRQLADWVARGTYPIGISTDVDEIQALREEGLPIEPVFPEDVPGVLTSGYGILRLIADSAHPDAANVMANWLASPKGAMVLQLAFDLPSTRSDVKPSLNVPEEVVPQEGVDYIDQNTEDYVFKGLLPGTQAFNEIIG
jgi:iron(III) transport system substrate-binding protein